MGLWDDVRTQVVDLYSQAAERTEEWTQIGVRRYDRFGLHRRLGREFAELGGFVHQLLRDGEFGDLGERPRVAEIVRRIDALEAELKAKEEEIESIRRRGEASDRNAGVSEESAPPDSEVRP